MFVVIAYDIPDDRRRTRVARLLQNYGQRVQRSVFECDVTPQHYAALRLRLASAIRHDTDSVRYYTLCRACVGSIETLNSPAAASSPPSYIV